MGNCRAERSNKSHSPLKYTQTARYSLHNYVRQFVGRRGPSQFNRSKRIAGNEMADIMGDITRDGGHKPEGQSPSDWIIAANSQSFPSHNRPPAAIIM